MTSEAPTLFPLAGKRVWVAGHRGMLGAALLRRLQSEACETITVERAELDLRRQRETEDWLKQSKPDAVFMAAATVGGIQANDTRPADFIYDNLAIETNVIRGAWSAGVEKLLFLGSSCVYPKHAAQPITEDSLLTGPLEPTNEYYAVAKIAGIKLCQAYRKQHGADFISAQPTNLYGPGDRFDLEEGHVVPALIAKTHEAKEKGAATVSVWGSGRPLREFLYVEDCADAIVHLMRCYSGDSQVNVGCGKDLSIRELAETIARVVGFQGALSFDGSKPDGTPRKLLDVSLMRRLGWTPRTDLEEGLRQTYDWFLEHRPR